MSNFKSFKSYFVALEPNNAPVKKRRLYTPHPSSDEEEEHCENQPQNSNAQFSSLGKTRETRQDNNGKKCVVINEKAINERAKLDEQAQNLTWTSIRPVFVRGGRRKLTTLSNPSLWRVPHRFNSKETANRTAQLLRSPVRRELERYDENFKRKTLEKIIRNCDGCDNGKIVPRQQQQQQQQHELKRPRSQKEEVIIPDNQLNKASDTRESHHQQQQRSDNTQIKSTPLVNSINCDELEQTFTQHEKSAVKGQNHISNRSNGINHGQFVSCQFVRYESSSDESDSKENIGDGSGGCACDVNKDREQKSRTLIRASQILNEWLSESVDNEIRRDAAASTVNEGRLLTHSKSKVKKEKD